MVKLPIYMDHHSTTPTDPRVLEAMLPYFTEKFGNAASRNHSFGWEAEEAVQTARTQVAELIGASPKELIFTSGATESNNLALKGIVSRRGAEQNQIVTVVTEHKAVLDPCRRLEQLGCEVTYLPVDRHGLVDMDKLESAITPRTALVSIMAANNEIGTLQPVEPIGKICKRHGVIFHTDAAQAAGKIPLDVEAMGIDLLSVSAHKLYGPKGVGALYVRGHNPRVRLEPIQEGGGHERGLRSGTVPVPSVVGLGRACQMARAEMEQEANRLRRLRDRLHSAIVDRIDEVHLNGHPTQRLPGNLNLSFAGVEGEALLMSLKDVAVSSGSACTSANPEPSYVLKEIGIGDELAHSSIRFGLGRFNTEEEADWVAEHVAATVKRLRSMSVLWKA